MNSSEKLIWASIWRQLTPYHRWEMLQLIRLFLLRRRLKQLGAFFPWKF